MAGAGIPPRVETIHLVRLDTRLAAESAMLDGSGLPDRFRDALEAVVDRKPNRTRCIRCEDEVGHVTRAVTRIVTWTPLVLMARDEGGRAFVGCERCAPDLPEVIRR